MALCFAFLLYSLCRQRPKDPGAVFVFVPYANKTKRHRLALFCLSDACTVETKTADRQTLTGSVFDGRGSNGQHEPHVKDVVVANTGPNRHPRLGLVHGQGRDHTCVNRITCTCAHTHICANTHQYSQIHKHAYTHIHTRTHTHTHIHTHTHAHTHTHIHTQTVITHLYEYKFIWQITCTHN